jgi:hypothetical protein
MPGEMLTKFCRNAGLTISRAVMSAFVTALERKHRKHSPIGRFPHVCCAINNRSASNGSDCFSRRDYHAFYAIFEIRARHQAAILKRFQAMWIRLRFRKIRKNNDLDLLPDFAESESAPAVQDAARSR